MTYINPRAKPFGHLDRLAGWQRGDTPAPVTLEWDLSNRCPWGCRDCHFAYTHRKGPWVRDARALPMAHDRGGDLADTAGVVRVLGDVAAAGVQGVVWTGGGEPTVHPDFLFIVRPAAAVGLQQGLYTLGATLTEFQTAFLRDSFAWVVVSLDHVTADDYQRDKRAPLTGFARACEAIRRLSGGACTVGASFLLHEHGEVRQIGLVAGIELVKDKKTKEPFPPRSRTGFRACLSMRDSGVILRPLGDVIIIMPPLSVKESELKKIVEAAYKGIKEITKGL